MSEHDTVARTGEPDSIYIEQTNVCGHYDWLFEYQQDDTFKPVGM